MGSIAQDADGNMGLAYSASSSTINPAIRFTGRLVSDTLGEMDRTEGSIIEGTGSQVTPPGAPRQNERWGDYTSTNIDPVDDCTFWHVNEYYDNDGGDWQIRVGSFRFNECGDPGFFFSAEDSNLSVCAGDDISYNITVGSVGEYDGSVALTTSDDLAASTVTISTNPVPSLPGITSVDLTSTAAELDGDYTINLMGTSAGVSDQSIDLALKVFADIPVSTSLTSPLDGAVDVDVQPSLNWTDVGAVDYTVEVATDAGFTDIVFTDTTTGTTLVPTSSLNANTSYFWRVIANNDCGPSNVVDVFSFTTSNVICLTIGDAIPDNTAAGIDFPLSLTESGIIESLAVEINATHTWVGDLIFTLSHDGTDVILMDRPGVPALNTVGCNANNVDAIFDDNGIDGPVEDSCVQDTDPGITGELVPQEPLAGFNGMEFSGDWVLNVSDNAGQDTGMMDQICFLPVLGEDLDLIFEDGFEELTP